MAKLFDLFNDLPVDWRTFGVGAFLMLLPLPLFFGKSVEYREMDRTWSKYVTAALVLPWHWLDLFRSFAGMWLMREAVGLSELAKDSPLPKRAIAVMAVVVGIAIVVQTIACKFPDSFHAAFAPVVGMVAALFPPIVSGLALISALMVALAFRSGVAFFGAVSLAIAAVGFPFYPKWPVLAVGVGASILPLLLPIMFHRELVVGHRRVPS